MDKRRYLANPLLNCLFLSALFYVPLFTNNWCNNNYNNYNFSMQFYSLYSQFYSMLFCSVQNRNCLNHTQFHARLNEFLIAVARFFCLLIYVHLQSTECSPPSGKIYCESLCMCILILDCPFLFSYLLLLVYLESVWCIC